MAFAARNYRIFCKVYNNNFTASYSTFRKSVTQIHLLSSIQKCRLPMQSVRFRADTIKNTWPSSTSSSSSSSSSTNAPFSRVPNSQNEQKSSGSNSGSGSSQENANVDEDVLRWRLNNWKYTKYSLIGLGVWFGISGGWFIYQSSLPPTDDHGKIILDEFSDMSFIPRAFNRAVGKIRYWTQVIKEPASDKLLPDFPYPFHPPTLVLELTDVLVHPEWTYKTGWRFKKRPGVDLFLESLSQYYELVIYTTEPPVTVGPVLMSLDPQGMTHKLMREATRFIDGHHIKDLNALNRDLKKVIVVDWDPNKIKLHPDNLFKIPRWDGNDDDTTLFYLASFLKTVASMDVSDVREVLTYYQQFDDPIAAFIINQQNFMKKMQEDDMMKKKSETNKSLISKWSPSFHRSP